MSSLTSGQKPYFSVVMPVYNCDPYVGRAIESVLAQTERDFEFVIIDDASTDLTPKIVEFYKRQDDRIKTHRNDTNVNVRRSLNKAIALAQGEWIVHIDADDFFNANFLEKIRPYSEKINDREYFVSTWVTIVDEHDKNLVNMRLPHASVIEQMMKYENFLYHPATSFQKATWVKVGGYPEDDLTLGEDAALWLKFLESGIKLLMIPEFLVNYRVHYFNVTSFNDARLSHRQRMTPSLAFRMNREWRISLFLKQKMLKSAREELFALFQRQKHLSLKNIQYLLLTFLPQSFVHFFMWELRPHARYLVKKMRRKQQRI